MHQNIVRSEIGEVLRLLRIANDLSISELSKKTSISKSYITEIEKGKKNPSDDILRKYSSGLEIPEEVIKYFLNNYSNRQISYQKLLIKILNKISKL